MLGRRIAVEVGQRARGNELREGFERPNEAENKLLPLHGSLLISEVNSLREVQMKQTEPLSVKDNELIYRIFFHFPNYFIILKQFF